MDSNRLNLREMKSVCKEKTILRKTFLLIVTFLSLIIPGQTHCAHGYIKWCKCLTHAKDNHKPNKCRSCLCKPSFPAADLLFEQRFVTGALGVQLNAQTYSSNTGGLDILFLPGSPFDFLLWANVVSNKKLLESYNIHTMQTRGTGAGPFPDPFGPQGGYTLATTWADDIHAVITHLKMTPGNVVLVAHSASGLYVADYIRKYGQDDLKGIVLAAATAEPILTTSFGGTQLNPEYAADIGQLLTAGLVKDSDGYQTFIALAQKITSKPKTQYWSTCYPNGNDSAHYGVLGGVFQNEPYALNTVLAILSHEPTLNLSPIGPPSITDITTGVWPFVTVPTLIIQGTNDRVTLPSVASPALHEAIPGSKLKYIKCAGHIIWQDNPKEFNCVLHKFLKALP